MGVVLAAPVLVLIAALVFYPLGLGFNTSLRSVVLGYGLPERFVGVRNYVNVLGDPETLSSVLRTARYVAIAVSIELVGGLAVALALNRPFRGRGLVIATLIIPWALPSVVSSVLWLRILNPSETGLLNSLLYQLNVIDSYKVWFNTNWAIFLISLVHVWGMLPFITLILFAGLQGIRADLYDAAAVDGATTWAQFRQITLPLLRPAIAVALTVGTVNAFSIFDEIYVLNGAALNTRSIMMQVYQTTFQKLDFGRGTALALLMMVVTGVFAIGYVRGLRRVAQ